MYFKIDTGSPYLSLLSLAVMSHHWYQPDFYICVSGKLWKAMVIVEAAEVTIIQCCMYPDWCLYTGATDKMHVLIKFRM